MKKLLISLICLFALSIFSVNAISLPEKTDHEKVTIYVFRGSGCSHCYEALEYLNDNINKYSDYIDVVTYETWEDSSNATLLQAVAEAVNEDVGGVPFIVIGSTYHKAGFATSLGEELIQTALDEYENTEYVDVVAQVATTMDSNPAPLRDACIAEGIKVATTNEEKSNDALIIIGIFAVIIGGFTALMVCSRKK